MKRFLAWLFRNTEHGTRAPVLIDLPEEYGARLRVNDVHGLFLDAGNRAVINALVQVLWMHRAAAQKRALDAAAVAAATGNAAFHLGEIECVNNVVASIQHLLAERLEDDRGNLIKWTPTEGMREWFVEEPAELRGEG